MPIRPRAYDEASATASPWEFAAGHELMPFFIGDRNQ